MLGGSCSPCCGCTQEKANTLNAQLRSMLVECQITQQSYVPQSGVFLANSIAITVAKWSGQGSSTPPPTLDDCRAEFNNNFLFNSITGGVRLHEEQVSQQPYSLYLDASEATPVFRYQDPHIEIVFACQFSPFIGSELTNDNTGCRFIWALRVYKLRRESFSPGVRVRDVLAGDLGEATYGPEFIADSPTNPTWGDTTAAAVTRYFSGWDYEELDSANYDIGRPFSGRGSGTVGYKVLGADYAFNGQSKTSKPLIYYNALLDSGTGTVVRDSNGGIISLTLDQRTNSNSAFAFRDRTTTETQLEPMLVESPSYALSRVNIGTVRFKQSGTTSQKTYSYVGSSYTASAVVTLTPPT